MRAVVFDEYGDADRLHVAEVEPPVPGPGQVRVVVRAAGVNPVDWKIRSGASRAFFDITFPHVGGMDAAGVVDAIGEGVTGVALGDEVFGQAVSGGYAELALLGAWARRPPGLDWAEAGGYASAVETGLRAVDLLGVTGGETILVSGAAGGVGLAACQFALARGAQVVGTASAANHEYLRSKGIVATSYGDGLVERVRALGVGAIDRALDAAGHGVLPDLIALTGSPERVITVADGRAAEHAVTFTGGSGRRYWEALDRAARLQEQGSFELPVAARFSFDHASEAHRVSEAGHVLGKLVLLPA